MGNFKQGDDYKAVLDVVQTPAVDFSTASEIVAVLYNGTEEQYKYSLNTKSGYGVLEVDGVDENKLNLFIERDHSASFTVGSIRAYILAKYVNAEFPDGDEIKSYEVTVGRVLEGKALNEDI